MAANYSLEIIQPLAGLDTTNRFYKAYPGFEYNVRMAVIGGTYPFTYSLTTAPAGMTINSRTGEITWSNPLEAGSPHSVTAKVVDSEASEQTVSWTITVTTTGFIFIDGVNGNRATTTNCSGVDGANSLPAGITGTGTGTIDNPFMSMADLYGGMCYNAKHTDRFKGSFVYWKTGTYDLEAMKENCYVDQTDVNNECRVPFVNARKATVWLAYPGNTPVINQKLNDNDAYIMFYDSTNNVYIDGLTFDVNDSSRSKSVVFGGGNNHTFRRNTSYGINHHHAGGNAAYVFITPGTNYRYSVQDNIGRDLATNGYFVLGYNANKVLIENNTVTNIQGQGIGLKTNTKEWTVRGNSVKTTTVAGIATQCYPTLQNTEISHNYVVPTSGNAMFFNGEYNSTTGATYVHHNTIIGPVQLYMAAATNGPWSIYNNVIVNSTTGDKIIKTSWSSSDTYTNTDNLTDTDTANVVDSNGLLIPAQSAYVGSRGWQLAGGDTPLTLNVKKRYRIGGSLAKPPEE
jgi:hypothetical protein